MYFPLFKGRTSSCRWCCSSLLLDLLWHFWGGQSEINVIHKALSVSDEVLRLQDVAYVSVSLVWEHSRCGLPSYYGISFMVWEWSMTQFALYASSSVAAVLQHSAFSWWLWSSDSEWNTKACLPSIPATAPAGKQQHSSQVGHWKEHIWSDRLCCHGDDKQHSAG